MNCCDDYEPESKKLNGPIILAQARNPHLTSTPEFAFKHWVFCPWCGKNLADQKAEVEAFISAMKDIANHEGNTQ